MRIFNLFNSAMLAGVATIAAANARADETNTANRIPPTIYAPTVDEYNATAASADIYPFKQMLSAIPNAKTISDVGNLDEIAQTLNDWHIYAYPPKVSNLAGALTLAAPEVRSGFQTIFANAQTKIEKTLANFGTNMPVQLKIAKQDGSVSITLTNGLPYTVVTDGIRKAETIDMGPTTFVANPRVVLPRLEGALGPHANDAATELEFFDTDKASKFYTLTFSVMDLEGLKTLRGTNAALQVKEQPNALPAPALVPAP